PHSPFASADPSQPWFGFGSSARVPYQARSTRPGSSAAAQGKMFVRRPEVEISTGAVHVRPSSREPDRNKRESPPPNGSWSQTTYRLPARSIASVTPPTKEPRVALTARSTHLSPLGTARLNRVRSHRATRTSSAPRRFAAAAARGTTVRCVPGLAYGSPSAPIAQG